MLKPDSLRAAITAAIPGLERNPDKLAIWVDQGQIFSRLSPAPGFPNPGFEYRYRLNALLLDLEHDPDTVMIAVILWLQTHQPELLNRPCDAAFPFECDVRSAKSVDLSIELQLSERVRAVPRDGGGYDLVHLQEPPAIAEFEGVPRWTPATAIFVDGQRVAGSGTDG